MSKNIPRFTISDVTWKQILFYADMETCEASVKFKLTFDKIPSPDVDESLEFTLIALDNGDYAVYELDFYGYTLPKSRKSLEITKRFDCSLEIYNMIESWVVK